MTSRAPLIAALMLLLLPVPYVGSYLALMTAEPDPSLAYHRVSGTYPGHVQRFFWPLELIDRKLRPRAWEKGLARELLRQIGPH